MKQHQKPCIKRKKVVDRGKRIKTRSEVKPVENVSKNLSFLEISHIRKEVLPSHKLQEHAWHPGTSEISTSPEIAVGMHFHALTWHWNYPSIFTCWWWRLLVATSKLSLLTLRRHGATRKHLFLDHQTGQV